MPDLWKWIGSAIICASALILLWIGRSSRHSRVETAIPEHYTRASRGGNHPCRCKLCRDQGGHEVSKMTRCFWWAASLATLSIAFPVGGVQAQDKSITIVLSEEPDIVDPCEASRSNVGRIVKQNITETFTEIDPKDGSITPRLAESWEQVDPSTWRFKLKQGVKFHDGTDFNAQNAAYSIKRTLNEKIDCEIRLKFFGGVKLTPKAIDDHTLEIKTSEPSPILPTMLGTMTVVSPNTPMDERTREPIGTGPYKFVSWTPGQAVVLERFDGYWGGKPEVEKATYV
jgi:peptide/nickel transport system substrate-binding protein